MKRGFAKRDVEHPSNMKRSLLPSSLPLPRIISLNLSFSLSYTHTHTHSLSLFQDPLTSTYKHLHTLALSLSLFKHPSTHTRTRTQRLLLFFFRLNQSLLTINVKVYYRLLDFKSPLTYFASQTLSPCLEISLLKLCLVKTSLEFNLFGLVHL